MTPEGLARSVAGGPSSAGPQPSSRWSSTAAILGAALWLAAPLVPSDVAVAFGSIEHTFVFLPLVLAPLLLLLFSRFFDSEGAVKPLGLGLALWFQPFASAMVLASFFFPKGAVAGALTAGWVVMAVLLFPSAVGGFRLRTHANLSNVSLVAGQLFLLVGAVWLTLSRLGTGPRNFTELTVFLAALHFHYSGFTLQSLLAASGRRLPSTRPRLAITHRVVAVGSIIGIPLIAAGNIAAAPIAKFIGVTLMVSSCLGLAVSWVFLALDVRHWLPKTLLVVSAASVAAGMVLAGVYGIGEVAGPGWIGIPRMVVAHGLLNSLGFVLCGLLGNLLLLPGAERLSPRKRSAPAC